MAAYGCSSGDGRRHGVVDASRLTQQKRRRKVHVTLSRMRKGGRSFNSALFAGVKSETHVTFFMFQSLHHDQNHQEGVDV